MSFVREGFGRLWHGLERFAASSWVVLALVATALTEFAVVSAATPLIAGRDLGTYLRASFELRQGDIALPQALLMRAPVTGVVSEAFLTAGPVAAEVAMAALYALSVLCWWRVGYRIRPVAGLVFAVLVLVYPGFAFLFHGLSSDALFAGAFALAALLTARLVESPSLGRAAAVGVGLALLVLIRPVSQILILLALLLLLLPWPWSRRFAALATLAVAAVVPLLAWAGHNAVRADDLTVVRGAGHGLPLYRAFVVDRIVEPGNGPASRELAQAVQDDLLPREPYRSYRIGLDTFFSAGSARMHEDLIGLSDRTWGWDDDYSHLARVGREAVRAHPSAYARGVGRDAWRLVWWPLFLSVGDAESAGARQLAISEQLPVPSEGQPIPSASVSGFISTPEGRFREVWTSATEHEIVADDPGDAAHLDRMNRRVDELYRAFSDRDGKAELVSWLNRASRWFPRPVAWLVVGLLAVAIRRPRGAAVPLVLAAAAGLVTIVTVLAVPATAEYSVPLVPAFMLLTVWGVLGTPRRYATF